MSDRCLVHGGSARECVEDELCGWCARPRGSDAIAEEATAATAGEGAAAAASAAPAGGLCVSRWLPHWAEPEGGGSSSADASQRAAPVCAGPLHVVAASVPEWWGSEVQRRQLEEQQQQQQQAEEAGAPAEATSHDPPPMRGLAADGSLSPAALVSPADCALLVTRAVPAVFSLDGTSKMAYHFFTVRREQGVEAETQGRRKTQRGACRLASPPPCCCAAQETAAGWVNEAARDGGLGWLRVHAWTRPRSQPEFLPWLHLFSNACHRSLAELGSEGMRQRSSSSSSSSSGGGEGGKQLQGGSRATRAVNGTLASLAAAGNATASSSNLTAAAARAPWPPQAERKYPVCYAEPAVLRRALKAAAAASASAGGGSGGGEDASLLSPRSLFGLADPLLAEVDHATGALLGPSALELEAPLVAVRRCSGGAWEGRRGQSPRRHMAVE